MLGARLYRKAAMTLHHQASVLLAMLGLTFVVLPATLALLTQVIEAADRGRSRNERP
ncbi:hypothetical protein SAMN05444161_8420 [Rhizobiales bacterium GAS191]|nr:hypothetical protein SAMN05444161_8420 [Rhizobiales bacterium GAS191]